MPEQEQWGIEASITLSGVTIKWNENDKTVSIKYHKPLDSSGAFTLTVDDWDELHRWILLARNGFEPINMEVK